MPRELLKLVKSERGWTFSISGRTGVHTTILRDGTWVCSCSAGAFSDRENPVECSHIKFGKKIIPLIESVMIEYAGK